MPDEDELWSIKDFCAFLKVGKSTVWDGVRTGRFPKPVKIGGVTRWRKSHVVAWLSAIEAK